MDKLKKRFLKRIDLGSECWLWTGCKNKQGYGSIRVQRKTQLAHRIAYLLFVGVVPSDKDVLHKCDIPGCVCPDHLFLGTAQDNSRDMILKNRSVGKFSVKQIQDVRSQYCGKPSWAESARLAQEYGVHPATIHRIILQKTWSVV